MGDRTYFAQRRWEQREAIWNRGPRHVPSEIELNALRRELEEAAAYLGKRIDDYVLVPSLALSLGRCVRALQEARDYTTIHDDVATRRAE
jgi:hypothetical protein